MKPTIILFDVNETLLDMSPLKKQINKLLKSKRGFRIWFGMLLQYSLVDTITGIYHDFTTIAKATLDMAATALEQTIEEKEKEDVLKYIKQLHAYNDVKKGLQQLKDAGFRLATLTNSPKQTLDEQLKFAGLTDYFEQALSIDECQKYKPAKETYHYAAEKLAVHPQQIVMVAAHGWDIAGALQAGLQTAFIQRKGQSLYPLIAQPQYTGDSITDIAEQLIQQLKQYE